MAEAAWASTRVMMGRENPKEHTNKTHRHDTGGGTACNDRGTEVQCNIQIQTIICIRSEYEYEPGRMRTNQISQIRSGHIREYEY